MAVDGRLRWRSWEDKNGGGKRSKVDIVAQTVQFLGSRDDNQGGGGQSQGGGVQAQANQGFAASSDVPADTDFGDPVAAPAGGGADDDIPF